MRQHVPRALDVQSIFPGRTLAMLALIDYRSGSTLTYRELILSPALVRAGGRIGAWISHIYVDSPRSLAAGREVWGLPKQLAGFTWTLDAPSLVTATSGSIRVTCEYDARGRGWQLPLMAPAFGMSATHSKWLLARGRGRVARTTGTIRCDGPDVAHLGFSGAQRLYCIDDFDLEFPAPLERPLVC